MKRDSYIVELAAQIIEDAELSRCSVESLVLKAHRLAQITGAEEMVKWLNFERFGYNAQDPLSLHYMTVTGRWTDRKRNMGWWGPIGQQEILIEGYRIERETIGRFSPSGQFNFIQLDKQQEKIRQITATIMQLSGIIAKVKAIIQSFAAQIYQARVFSGEAESIFDKYKTDVDAMLSTIAEDAFRMMPEIFDRLSSNDGEAITHALTSCRRVIDRFADAVFPPGNDVFKMGEQELSIAPGKTRNRLRAYVYGKIGKNSRFDRIVKTLSMLYDRLSTGVHAEVDGGEARALVLQTYLLIGEILSLGSLPAVPQTAAASGSRVLAGAPEPTLPPDTKPATPAAD